MQFLLRLAAGLIEKSDLQIFLNLKDHLEQFQRQPPSAPNSWENIQLMAKAAKEYSKAVEPLPVVEKMMCLVNITLGPLRVFLNS